MFLNSQRHLLIITELLMLSPTKMINITTGTNNFLFKYYRLTNWLMFLCGQIQSPRPDVMPDRREGIARAEGFVLPV